MREYYKRNSTVRITPVGFFEGRSVDDLNRGIEPKDDALCPCDNRFYWELERFDALLDNGSRCELELRTAYNSMRPTPMDIITIMW